MPPSLVLTLRRISRNNQLPHLQRRIRARQPLRHGPRIRLPLPKLRPLRIRQILIHRHAPRPRPMTRHIRIGHILHQPVPALRHFPMHVPGFRDQEIVVRAVGVQGERLQFAARGEQFGEAFVVVFEPVRVPGAVVAYDHEAAVDAELHASRPSLPAVVAEHFLDFGGEGRGDVVPSAAVGAPGEEGAVRSEGYVEGAVGEGGLVLVHPFEEGGVCTTQILVVFSVVPYQEPGSIVTVRHVIRLWLDRLFFLVRYGSLHAAEEFVLFERWSLWFGFVGVGVWEKLLELFRRVFRPTSI